MDKKILDKINQLGEKYSSTGQDLCSYLDGLLYSDYISYWNYIKLDTLLTLQNPKTDFPDENIFIIYHQITELYFKLCLLEIEHINKNGRNVIDTGQDLGWNEKIRVTLFIEKLERINKYIKHLISSFEIMTDGMDKDQFRKFRMALLPSSGFQSIQFRMIELRSSPLKNLTRSHKAEDNVANYYKKLYWKFGASDLKTQQKTYTLRQFEKKYDERLLKLCNKMTDKNIWMKYRGLSKDEQKNSHLIKLLKTYDYNVNINWKLAHYKSVVKHLKEKNKFTPATGGTNWEAYLPPKFQKIIFFPELWTEKEKKEWGKKWTESIF